METGKLIRAIRKNKNFKSKDVYKNILTMPAISRFESGTTEGSWDMSNVKQIIQSLGAYLGDVGVEFKKISWPDRQELVDSTIVVITFIVILAVVVLC